MLHEPNKLETLNEMSPKHGRPLSSNKTKKIRQSLNSNNLNIEIRQIDENKDLNQ